MGRQLSAVFSLRHLASATDKNRTNDALWLYEGEFSIKFPQALALLLQQIYSSNWSHMKALGIFFKWVYSSLISDKK